MADNTTLNTGSGGDVIATDDIAGVKYQRTKVVWGVDGAATDASASNPLPTVQTGALPAGTNAIGKLAANSGVVIGDVNAVTAPATAADNAVGLPAVTTVVAGYDGTNVQALATNAAGNLQVGLSASLPAGANAVGKLAANSGVVIGDVNAVTLPGALAGKAEDAASASGDVGIPILGVRRDVINTSWTSTDGDYMMLSANAVGALYVVTQDPMPISDNGSSITVDNGGTFAVQADTELPAAAATVKQLAALGGRMMFCYCGKLVWPYDEATWTCKDGHHTAIEGAAVQQLDAAPEWAVPAAVKRVFPWQTAALVAAGIAAVELANLLL